MTGSQSLNIVASASSKINSRIIGLLATTIGTIHAYKQRIIIHINVIWVEWLPIT